MTGRISKALSGFYYAETPEGTLTCRARGKFRHSGVSPLVGDRVECTALGGGEGVIESVLPRRNAFDRPAVCVMECQHYRPEVAHEVLRQLPVSRFIGVHISDRWNADPAGFVAALGDVAFPVELAQDGMEFTL